MPDGNVTLIGKRPVHEILARYEQGEQINDIALDYGLKAGEQIYRQLLAECPEEWKHYQAARALRRLECATADLESEERTANVLSLARARERLKAAQWELERLCRRLYGDHVDVSAVIAQVDGRDADQRVLDAARDIAFVLARAAVHEKAVQHENGLQEAEIHQLNQS